MPFRDLDDFLVIRPIELPIRGKRYQFPGSISGHAGLLLHRLSEVADEARRRREEGLTVDDAQEVLDDEAEVDLRRELLGDAEQEMVEDGLSTAHISHVFQTLMVWHLAGPEAAEAAWERMAVGPQEPTRAERRAGSGKKSSRSPDSPGGSTSRRSPQARRGGPSSNGGRS